MNALRDLVIDYVIVYVDDVMITYPDIEPVLEALTKASFFYEMFLPYIIYPRI